MTETPLVYEDEFIRSILKRIKTIAMVGASTKEMRPSYFSMLYLQKKGYRIFPVNPIAAGSIILGETVWPDLASLPDVPDMVQVFRRADQVPPIVDETIAIGSKVLWMQLSVRHDEAAAKAEAAGLDVVMDRCPKIEYGRLFGEIGWLGVNRNVLTSRRGTAIQLSKQKGQLQPQG